MLKRSIPLLILGIGIAGFVLLSVTRPEPETVDARERSWLVEVMPVEPAEHAPVLPLYGELIAPEQTTITSPLSGRIEHRPVREGQRVRSGDLLVALDDADIAPLLEQAEADVLDLQAQLRSEKVRHAHDREALKDEQAILDNARRQFERTQSMVNRGLASEEALDRASDALARARLAVAARQRSIDAHPSRIQSLEARLTKARAVLASTRRDASRATVTAPFDGIVTNLEVAEGDRVATNASLLTLYPEAGLELRARVPDRVRPELLDALSSGKELQAVTEDGRHSFTLVRFAGTSDAAGTQAILTLNGEAGNLRPGDMVAVTLQRPTRKNAISIPFSALYGSDSIYIMTDESRMQRVAIKRLGQARSPNGERHVLISAEGLQASDALITTHLPNAMTGLRVELAGASEESDK